MAYTKPLLLILLSLAFQLEVCLGQEDTVIVDLPTMGQIQGRRGVTSRDQTPYWTFHGIPYADPESYTGISRFGPSRVYDKPLMPDGEVFEANKILLYCPQEALLDFDLPIPYTEDGQEPKELVQKSRNVSEIMKAMHENKKKRNQILSKYKTRKERMEALKKQDMVRTMGNESCLTVAVNTPSIPTDPNNPAELLPVVVFFHGGGSESFWGSAFTALRLLEHKILLVTMNYRLGVLGALNLGTNGAPGCAEMYDAVTVLEWIQKNIRYFGGDPNRVTITGQSAGAMIVANLLGSPLAKDRGLFHGVWAFSGSAINVWAISKEPSLPHHLEIAELSGCYDPQSPVDAEAITTCMKEADVDVLINALYVWKYEEVSNGRLGYDARVPSIQAPGLSIPYFMPKHPFDVLENLEQSNVSVVMGSTRHDGSYPLNDIYNDWLKPNGLDKNETFIKNDMLPTILRNLGIVDDSGELYHAMAKTYLGNASLTGTLPDKFPGMMDMVTVMGFKAGEYETLKSQSKINKNSYFYSFDYQGRFTLYTFLNGDTDIPGGIAHTDELIYWFWLGPLLNEDMKVSRRWINYFVNFAYYGDPNGEKPARKSVIWEPYNSMTHPFMQFGRHDKILYSAPDEWIGNSKELFDEQDPGQPSPTPTTGTTTTPSTTTPSDGDTTTTPATTTPSATTTSTTTPQTSPDPTTGSSGGENVRDTFTGILACLLLSLYFKL